MFNLDRLNFRTREKDSKITFNIRRRKYTRRKAKLKGNKFN